MSTCLDQLLADRDAREPVLGPCAAMPILSEDQCLATDDMADFAAKAKGSLAADFVAMGWGNTAAGELAEIHVFGGAA